MHDVRLAVLGPVRVVRDGHPVDVGGPRQRAVLALLAIAHGDLVPADRLVDAVWGDDPPADPLAALQTFVSRLRRGMQPDTNARDRGQLLISSRSAYALGLDDERVDAWHFDRLVTQGSSLVGREPAHAAALLIEALGLWSGPAFVEYRDQPWAGAEIARLDELREVARDQLAAARLACGDGAVLVPELEALVAAAPLREQRWHLLVLALYRAQRQADALAALRRARAVLSDELGVDPGPALRELEKQVFEQSPALDHQVRDITTPTPAPTPTPTAQATTAPTPTAQTTTAPRTTTTPTTTPTTTAGPPQPAGALGRESTAGAAADDPLVERQRELDLIDDCLRSARTGRGALAMVEGPAGIGKSRLLTEARRRAGELGLRVVSARASQLEQEFAFGVARQLFEPLLTDSRQRTELLAGPAAASEAAFDLAGPSAGGDDASFAVLHGLYWLTVNLASGAPTLLVVDDIHWSDTGSLRFLAYLGRRLEGMSVALVMAYRTGEQHALGVLIDELRQDAATVSVSPVPLTRDAVGVMISDRLGESADAEFVSACFDGTAGNPLLVRQLLRALEADGVPPDRAHAEKARALGSRAVSSMILLRLRRFSPAATAVVRALAVLGDEADLPHVAELSHVPEDEVAALSATLVNAEIVRPEPPLAFVHPLVRDAVYGDVPPAQRELLHDTAARILERAGRDDEQVAAQLLFAPRRGEQWVVDVLRRAAADAVRRGSADGAVTLLTRALAEPPAPDTRPSVLLELGLVETSTDGPAAGRDLRAAYDTLADDHARAAAALALTRTLVFVGDFGSPVRFAERALAGLPDRFADERAAVLAYQRIAGHMHGVDPDVWHFADEPAVDGTGYGFRMLQAAVSYDRMCRATPRADAVALAAASLSDGQLVSTDPGLLWVWSQVVLDLADEDVLGTWDEISTAAHQRGSLFSVLAVGFWRAWSLMRRGALVEAEHTIRAGMEQLDMWQRNATTLPYGRATLARVLFDQDRIAEAHAAAGDFDAAPSAIDGDRLLVEVQAQLLLAAGQPQRALRRLDTVTERIPQVTNPAWRRDRLLRCLAAARIGSRADAAEAVDRAEQLLALARQWGARGAIGETLLVLGQLSGRDGVDALRESVEQLAGSPRRVVLADALVALGTAVAPQPEAVEALHEAHRIGVATGAARVVRVVEHTARAHGLPAPPAERQAVTGLSAVERRVLDLVAEGATLPEVSRQLFLPPATVERHLAAARRRAALPS